jgi:hypothetical protein
LLGPLSARSGRDCFVAQGAPCNDSANPIEISASAVTNGAVSSSKLTIINARLIY